MYMSNKKDDEEDDKVARVWMRMRTRMERTK